MSYRNFFNNFLASKFPLLEIKPLKKKKKFEKAGEELIDISKVTLAFLCGLCVLARKDINQNPELETLNQKLFSQLSIINRLYFNPSHDR
jgi:hypothetical protein